MNDNQDNSRFTNTNPDSTTKYSQKKSYSNFEENLKLLNPTTTIKSNYLDSICVNNK